MRVKEKKRKAKKQTEKWIELLPLILILAVLPVVVHLKIVSPVWKTIHGFRMRAAVWGKCWQHRGRSCFLTLYPGILALLFYPGICAIEAERCGIFHESCTCFFCSRLSDHGTGK